MCNKCDQIIACKDDLWRLKVINFQWTDKYANEYSWAWTCMQVSSYCNSYLCKIVNIKPTNLLPELSGDVGITHHWILVKMLDGPKMGNTILVAKAWLDDPVLPNKVEPVLAIRIRHQPTFPPVQPINWGDSLKRYNGNRRSKEKSPSKLKYIIAAVLALVAIAAVIVLA